MTVRRSILDALVALEAVSSAAIDEAFPFHRSQKNTMTKDEAEFVVRKVLEAKDLLHTVYGKIAIGEILSMDKRMRDQEAEEAIARG